jgi:hypothetical protein
VRAGANAAMMKDDPQWKGGAARQSSERLRAVNGKTTAEAAEQWMSSQGHGMARSFCGHALKVECQTELADSRFHY